MPEAFQSATLTFIFDRNANILKLGFFSSIFCTFAIKIENIIQYNT